MAMFSIEHLLGKSEVKSLSERECSSKQKRIIEDKTIILEDRHQENDKTAVTSMRSDSVRIGGMRSGGVRSGGVRSVSEEESSSECDSDHELLEGMFA